jgi:mannose-1-phosphate guanylyltransferase
VKLLGEKSLFQLNYEALRIKFEPHQIFVSTNVDQFPLARDQAPEIPLDNYILEPEMRNQGPATCLIAAVLYRRGFADEPFMLVQADDLREPPEKFLEMMSVCDEIAKKDPRYITGGFHPPFSVSGVDYLVRGKKIEQLNGVSVYEVDRYVSRKSEELNEGFIKDGGVFVHANHTCMTPRNFLDMIKSYKAEWYDPSFNIANGADVNAEFTKMPVGTLEEVTQEVHKDKRSLIVELPFKWSDFGTYDSLYRYVTENNLYKKPINLVEKESNSNFVLLDDPNKVVCLIGVENIVVVDTGDVILISDRRRSDLVGEMPKEIKDRGISMV